MDNLGKIALVAGGSLLLGAAIQKASDNYVRDCEAYDAEHKKLKATVEDQKDEIRELKKTVAMLEKRT